MSVVRQEIPRQVAVAIVGAGPVGLMAANLLGTYGVATLIIDRNPGPMDIPRAIALDDEGARTLQAVGLDRDFMPRTEPAGGARYLDHHGQAFAEVGAPPPEFGFPRRNYFFQPELEQTLVDGLARFSHVTMAFATNLDGFTADNDGVTLRLPGGQVRADYLIGADGARSSVRQALGIAMEGDTYPQDWLIVDTENDPDREPVSKFFCRADRPFVSIPAPRGGRRYEFQLAPGEVAGDMVKLERVREILAPLRQLPDADITRVTVYTFEARIAARFSHGRVFLAGDAAHLTPPFAGQGMNAGLRDAHNLTWKLAVVLGGRSSPELLESYDGERRGPAWAMVQLAVAMGEIVMPQAREDIEFRQGILRQFDRFPQARDFIVGMKFKPRPRYDGGAFVDLHGQLVAASLVGAMLPQPDLLGPARLDDALGAGFALLAQAEDTAAFVAANQDLLWPELSPSRVFLSPAAAAALDGITSLVAKPGPGLVTVRAHRDQILLVRPDRYVAAAFWPEGAAAAVTAFRDAVGHCQGR
ncbi:MAG: bifunctional 3-(3-hydroxy-phenyl)propionate/3-hydroxycinnamic acid hydroxylase [Alphaproteobacteria bacterium]